MEFNPELEFCYHYRGSVKKDSLVELCPVMSGDGIYDLETEYCDGEIYDKCCGGRHYNSQEFCVIPGKDEFCYEEGNIGTLLKHCNGQTYNPNTQFCFNNERPVELCGGHEYDADAYACVNDVVKGKCGSNTYDLETEGCFDNVVRSSCGGIAYSTLSDFCYDNDIYEKCEVFDRMQGGIYTYKKVDFNPTTHFCAEANLLVGGHKILELCNGEKYDIINEETCSSGIIVKTCGDNNTEYNVKTQFCRNGTIMDLCNGQEYTSNQFCYEGPISFYGISKFNCTELVNAGYDYTCPSSNTQLQFDGTHIGVVNKCPVKNLANRLTYVNYNITTGVCADPDLVNGGSYSVGYEIINESTYNQLDDIKKQYVFEQFVKVTNNLKRVSDN